MTTFEDLEREVEKLRKEVRRLKGDLDAENERQVASDDVSGPCRRSE
jgi:hypothetical protein